MNNYSIPLSYARPAYELRAFIFWMGAIVCLLAFAIAGELPARYALIVCAALVPFASVRGWQGWRFVYQKLRFFRYFSTFLPSDALNEKIQAGKLFLGWGFDWTKDQAQVAYSLLGENMERYRPNVLLLVLDKWLHRKSPAISDIGQPWIHALGEEKQVELPLRSRVGNTVIWGVPGAGKTRLIELMIRQDVRRGDIVIMIDPKRDEGLIKAMEEEAKRAGRPFVYFHPADAARSVRWDTLLNYNRNTEIAGRVTANLASSKETDNFVAFAWSVIDTTVGGILLVGKQPTLAALNEHIQWGPDRLLVEVLESWLSRKLSGDYQVRKSGYVNGIKGKASVEERERDGLIQFYRAEVSKRSDISHPDIDALIALVEHNREHYGKMITGLLPVLRMLTAGELHGLLSPNRDDLSDTRAIWDMTKVIKMGAVCYIGLDSLADARIGSVLGSMFNAELVSVAASIYNSAPDNPVTVRAYNDEFYENINEPLVQGLNKGRGAGFDYTLATQTLSDPENATGSKAAAHQIIGLCNNQYFLRSRDPETLQYIERQIPKTAIKTFSRSQSAVSGSEQLALHFAGSRSTSMGENMEPLFPASLLTMLPDLHYVASVAGGRLIKGRIPIITN